MDLKKTQILLAEDEENMGALLRDYLNIKGYSIDWYTDGEQASTHFLAKKYDLCILDVMMPKKDGFTVAREIRHKNPHVPVIFLTAKSMGEDIKEGFSTGADDYITKPFSIEELLYRIEAILRRSKRSMEVEMPKETVFAIGNYTFDFGRQTLAIGTKEISLTAKESDLLRLLCVNKNQILDRNYTLSTVWTGENYFNARSMDVYITKLRKYLSEDSSVQIINVRGRGFKLVL
jgi:DNA-binding response OmpR family regulator